MCKLSNMPLLFKTLLLIGLSVMIPSSFAAGVSFRYVTTDGTDTISGTFATNAGADILEGSGSLDITIAEFTSFYLNGVDQSEFFDGDAPTSASQASPFRWSKDDQEITSEVFHLGGDFVNSWVQIAYPGSGDQSAIVDSTDNSPNTIFHPIFTSVTVVPEPSDYVGAAFLGVFAFIFVRRFRRAKQHYLGQLSYQGNTGLQST